jgi:NADPH:quinone reductase
MVAGFCKGKKSSGGESETVAFMEYSDLRLIFDMSKRTMTTATHTQGLQLRSVIKSSGELQLSLANIKTPLPGPDEIVVRIQATPINPSDIGLLFGAADMTTAKASGSVSEPVITASVPERFMKGMAGRLDQSMPVGNEGAGVVVATGDSPAARALLGKTVAVLGGAMYSQYRTVPLAMSLLLPEGATPAQGASCFVNPLTALGMVETMRREGHTALVHTAAASNLGQMLNKICIQDGVSLVNIVRKPEQVALLKSIGAEYVCDSSSTTFMDDLTQALLATDATIGFDATGGGKLGGQILTCMEAALNRTAKEYSRYGSTTHKQVYLYGGLDTSATEFNRSFGMAWGMGGWLLFPFLQKIGTASTEALKARVAAELKTTFASHYAKEISLTQALQLESIAAYGQRATGGKYLINPSL